MFKYVWYNKVTEYNLDMPFLVVVVVVQFYILNYAVGNF